MCFYGSDKQVLVTGPFTENRVVGEDLVFGFLQLDQLAKFIRLPRFALANDFGVRLK